MDSAAGMSTLPGATGYHRHDADFMLSTWTMTITYTTTALLTLITLHVYDLLMTRHKRHAKSRFWSLVAEGVLAAFGSIRPVLLETAISVYLAYLLGMLPDTILDTRGGIQLFALLAWMAIFDAIHYLVHYLQHVRIADDRNKHTAVQALRWAHKHAVLAHKEHHKYHEPVMDETFGAGMLDTSLLIVLPAAISYMCVPFNALTFITSVVVIVFFSAANHAGYVHSWNAIFEAAGFHTNETHRVHHMMYKRNFSIFHSWPDRLFGTYASPDVCPGARLAD